MQSSEREFECSSGQSVRFALLTHRRYPWLAQAEAVQRLRTGFRRAAQRRPWVWEAAVVLPDVVYGVWRLPADDPDPRPRWRAVKAHCTRHLRHAPGLPEGRLWARGVEWSTLDAASSEAEAAEWRRQIDWMHWEPVRRGFVARPEAWRYSSYRRWLARGDYPEAWPGPSAVPSAAEGEAEEVLLSGAGAGTAAAGGAEALR
ncbi:hypothetical protein [Halorhodospira abdelmalekii]|uniref:hypothetical protein n=1 Tax=Halorhodospira abdelmalekii TaxID=421629 RepID=UPI001F5B7B6F|nr:hypothetical protein [Halorhodospira abdelmalekii]